MPSVDLRDLVGDIREALARHPPESLIEILTYVFKEYVIEGPAPLVVSAPALGEELAGRSFAEVVEYLKQHLDLPELALFEVQGDRVALRHGGQRIPIQAPETRPEPPSAGPGVETMAPPQAARPAPSAEAPAATPAAVETAPPAARASPPRPAPSAPASPAAPQAAAPPVAERPQEGAPSRAAQGATATVPAAAPASPAAPSVEESGDSSGRFHLLEID